MPKPKSTPPKRSKSPRAPAGPLVFGVTPPPGIDLGGSQKQNEHARAALLGSKGALQAAQNLSPRPQDPPKCPQAPEVQP